MHGDLRLKCRLKRTRVRRQRHGKKLHPPLRQVSSLLKIRLTNEGALSRAIYSLSELIYLYREKCRDCFTFCEPSHDRRSLVPPFHRGTAQKHNAVADMMSATALLSAKRHRAHACDPTPCFCYFFGCKSVLSSCTFSSTRLAMTAYDSACD